MSVNRNDVRQLQSVRDHPCLSILMPTHRTYPDNQQDPILLRNLITEAAGRLKEHYDKRQTRALLDRLEEIVAQIDFRFTLDGLAIFVSSTNSRWFQLPFPVMARTIIGETFETRDLVFTLNRSPRYWVLVLSEKPSRLYEGFHRTLTEVIDNKFPMTHLGPGGAEPLPGGFGIKRSAIRDEYDRQFFRHVDEALQGYMVADSLPLVILGVKRNLAFFEEVSNHTDCIAGKILGSYDKISTPKLAQMVWPVMQEFLAREREKVLGKLEKAIGARRFVCGIHSVWRAVHDGRGETLLLERNFHYPARVDETSFYPIPTTAKAAPDVLDDVVDELIEAALAKDSKVVFMAEGVLAVYQRIALILRY